MNNKKTAGRIQLILTLTVIIFGSLYVCSLTIDILEKTWLQWTSGFLVLLSVFYFIFGGFYYIETEKSNDSFNIKYYNIFPFFRAFKMFKIPIKSFIKYEIAGSKYFKRKLFLFQSSSNQIAKYPPVYITAFSKKDKNNLAIFFNEKSLRKKDR